MSAIAGIYHRSGSPARADSLAAISRRLAVMGPDGEEFVARGPVAMAYRPFETNRRARRVEWPAIGSDGTLIACDGRLDNRREVERALAAPAPAADDAQVLLAAYRQRGLQGLAMCVGDFALALWDPNARTLVLCSDALGRRPLFYRVTRETVLWASSARALVEGAGLSMALDEEHVAAFLANRHTSSSPFACVSRLPGGRALVAGPDRAEVVRYWSFDPNLTIRYKDDREYEEHFREVFQAAVACRLATDGPVFSELSGGLDSSAVTCVASRLVDRAAVPCPALRSVSYVYDQSRTSDERPFMQAVDTFLGHPSLHVLESAHSFLTPAAATLRPDAPTNKLWTVDQHDRVAAEMTAVGSRVLLSGLGGDHVMWSQPELGVLLADFVTDRRFGTAVRDAFRWSRLLKLPVTRLLADAWRFAHGKELAEAVRVAPWLDRGFVARTDFLPRMRRFAPEAAAFRLPTAALQCHSILSAMRPFALEPCLTTGYVDRRYPFLDRRLAEFALALPVDQKVRLGESRSILRRALKGLVPEVVLQRRTKAGPDEVFIRALVRQRHWVTTLLRDSRLCAHGFADRTALRAAVTRAIGGEACDQVQLARSLSLELWLRTLEERSSTPAATAPPGWRAHRRQQPPLQGESHGEAHDRHEVVGSAGSH